MEFSIKGRPPPSMDIIYILFFTPLFSFAIESYIYETDFTLGLEGAPSMKAFMANASKNVHFVFLILPLVGQFL